LVKNYGRFEWFSGFFRVNIPKSIDLGLLDPEVEGDIFLQNISNDSQLDTVLHFRLLKVSATHTVWTQIIVFITSPKKAFAGSGESVQKAF
jgi:hypothetical protein